MKLFRHMWFIALKDLRLFITDRMALAFALLFPFLFVVIFSFMLSNVGSDDPRLVIHLTTQEKEGDLSYSIIEAMETKDDTHLNPGDPEIIWLKDYNKARQSVVDKEISGFISFPPDFTANILAGHSTNLEVIVDAEAINTRAALHGVSQAIATQIGSQYAASSAIMELLIEEDLTGVKGDTGFTGFLSDQENGNTHYSYIDYKTEKVGEVEAENPANFVISGYLVMFVFFTAALSAETIVRERQNNTLERLLASSVRREAILGGAFLGTAIKGLIQILIFWTVGFLIFKLDMGQSPIAVILLSLLMVILSSAFAIMLATLVKTQRSAGSLGVLTSLVLAPLGGCWWPLFILPKWMQAMAKITPHGWANTGFNKLMLFGADFGAVVPEMIVLVAFAVVFGAIAVYRFRTSAI
ncbi:ABC transporter permease [Chloroflexota bacterium]